MNLNLKKVSLTILIAVNMLVAAAPSFADDKIVALTNSCGACHGENGMATNNDWPSLAGQKPGYLLAQLNAFKSGSRQNILMENQLTNLSDKELTAIAKHYSSLPFVKAEASAINKAGENVRSACLSCHGKNGKTVNDTWPNLAGQNKGYIFQQLKDYSSKKRESMLMNVIANELNEQQMRDVAEYFEQIGSVQ
ncbi:c-type cytochrome [Paraglaciecola arctica]|uniref:Cytochrome c domain-containing protein n=1 Tax=Paraglaciecola arctica BSs20135 TaxID=493475 RepID=K6Z5J5_9ALTE|nr:c-type cytochrome [Paraglaciecola arctica]GAC18710.1 hypothetical protein GARC_1738 [Paraglaciecola arctica BSs20135]